MGQQGTCVLVVIAACIACGSAMAAPHGIKPQQPQIKHAMLVGVEPTTVTQTPLTISSISPIQTMVDDMRATMLKDTLDTIAADTTLDVDEQTELLQLRDSFNALAANNTFHAAALSVIRNHLDSTSKDLGEQRLVASDLSQQLVRHQNTCLADAPAIAKEVDRLSHDLHLLGMLKTRLDELTNSNDSVLIAAVMAQVSSELVSASGLSSINALLEIDSEVSIGTDIVTSTSNTAASNNDTERVRRMQVLLERLISDVDGVLNTTLADLSNLTSSCSAAESSLAQALNTTNNRIDELAKVLEMRLTQEATEVDIVHGLDAQQAFVSAHLQVVEARVADRNEVFFALTRRRQTAVLILTQMGDVLSRYSSQLESLPVLD